MSYVISYFPNPYVDKIVSSISRRDVKLKNREIIWMQTYLGICLNKVKGTGKRGGITREDRFDIFSKLYYIPWTLTEALRSAQGQRDKFLIRLPNCGKYHGTYPDIHKVQVLPFEIEGCGIYYIGVGRSIFLEAVKGFYGYENEWKKWEFVTEERIIFRGGWYSNRCSRILGEKLLEFASLIKNRKLVLKVWMTVNLIQINWEGRNSFGGFTDSFRGYIMSSLFETETKEWLKFMC